MTDAILVDANVAVKWVLEEELSDRATALLADAIAARRRIVCPPHMPSEVVNAIYRRARRGDLTDAEVDEAVRTFEAFDLTSHGPPELYGRALAAARAHRLPTIYDSLYVALAALLDTPV